MSASSNRWRLYDIVDTLGYHKLPVDDGEHHRGLGEAVLWLRRHAPQSKCRKRLEDALLALGTARDELDALERQLTSVARAIEGDDSVAVAVEDIMLLDGEASRN